MPKRVNCRHSYLRKLFPFLGKVAEYNWVPSELNVSFSFCIFLLSQSEFCQRSRLQQNSWEKNRKDFTDTIWFLWPLFLKNFDRNFAGILQEFFASALQNCIEYYINNPMRLQKNSNSIVLRNWKSVASHPLESRKNLGLKVSNYPPPLIIIFPSNQKNWAVLVGDLENSSKLIKMFLTRPQWGQSFSRVTFDFSCIFHLTNQFPIQYLGIKPYLISIKCVF